MIGKNDMNPSSIDVVFELILNDMSAVFLLDIVYYVKQWVDEYRMCGVWSLVISNKSLAFVILYKDIKMCVRFVIIFHYTHHGIYIYFMRYARRVSI